MQAELVHEATLKRSIKAVRQRSRGEEPQKPEAYFVWDRDDLCSPSKIAGCEKLGKAETILRAVCAGHSYR